MKNTLSLNATVGLLVLFVFFTRPLFNQVFHVALCARTLGCSHPKLPAPDPSQFHVYSYYGDKQPSSDARTKEEDQRIIQNVVSDTYDHLSPDLQKVANQVVYYVDHNWEEITKLFMGFAAEDDPNYIYPDRTFFNPDSNPNGTIKVNFTEKFVQACDFLLMMKSENPRDLVLTDAISTWYRSVVAHEVLHAWQYHANPVLDLERNMKLIGSSDTDDHVITFEDIVKGHRMKIKYELDAYELTMSYFKPGQLELLADRTKQVMEEHPDLFEPGAKFSLLKNDRPNPFVNRYLLELSKDVKNYSQTGKPGTTWMMIYEGQIRPVEIYVEMKKISEREDLFFEEKKSKIAILYTEYQTYATNNFWKTKTLQNNNYLPDYEKKIEELVAQHR